jgi:ribose transport system ATP-binding protein
VHALVGGNGSGKTTLVRIVAGVVPADRGHVDAGECTFSARHVSPRVVHDLGLRFVHQEDSGFPSLSVAENLCAPAEYPRGRGGRIHWAELHHRARDVLDRFAIDADPRAPLDTLRPATRRMVQLARVLRDLERPQAGVLVLDEPSAALPAPDVERLHATLRRFAETGHAILYVTHRLDELEGFADRATVLRDGQVVRTAEAAELSHDRLVGLVSGPALAASSAVTRSVHPTRVRLELRRCRAGPLEDVDLVIHGGEIVGVVGLRGSGRSSLLRLAGGLLEVRSGEVRIDGVRPVDVAYVPESRDDASFPDLTVLENLSAASLDRFRRRLGWRRRAEREEGRETMARFGIRTRSLDEPFATLSGGNQQRALLARWLRRDPAVLLLDEPTQGVDVGARAEIHAVIRRAAGGGAAVMLVSSDLEELAALADRVVILVRGRVLRLLDGPDVTTAQLDAAVYGTTSSW